MKLSADKAASLVPPVLPEGFAFAYDGENYLYNDHNAELLMATCLAAAVADDDLVYGVDWIFSVNTDVYTERQTKLYVLSLAAKYLN